MNPAWSRASDDHATMALRSMRPLARRLADAGSRAARRTAADAWLLLQGTAAATAAWVIAKYVLDHEQPFFAPVAALIALNTSLGERGLNAVRLLQGVILGIVIGEVTLATLAGGYASMAVAIFTATALARALGGTRIVIAQAAVGAILTVAVADAEAGVERLTDALIGAGVALVFSQLLFAPEPVALLRRAEAAVLERLAGGLALTARALEQDDDELATDAIVALRELPDDVTDLRRTRRASTRVARRSLVWRSQRELVVLENENADHLDLLGGSCLLVARVAPSLTSDERRTLGPVVRELADLLAALAGDLGDRAIRQRAADRAFEVADAVAGTDEPPNSAPAAPVVAVRLLAIDLMVFAGVDLDDAVEAVREGVLEHRVRPPAPPSRGRLSWLRSRRTK
jgi:Fusaric acid resistance protein-like